MSVKFFSNFKEELRVNFVGEVLVWVYKAPSGIRAGEIVLPAQVSAEVEDLIRAIHELTLPF